MVRVSISAIAPVVKNKIVGGLFQKERFNIAFITTAIGGEGRFRIESGYEIGHKTKTFRFNNFTLPRNRPVVNQMGPFHAPAGHFKAPKRDQTIKLFVKVFRRRKLIAHKYIPIRVVNKFKKRPAIISGFTFR